MSLSCDYDFEPEPGMTYWLEADAIEPLKSKRARKCCSCGVKIDIGQSTARFSRYKCPEHEIELRIYGECWDNGVPCAPWFMCQECANLFFFLKSFNYAVNIQESMRDLAKEHAELIRVDKAGCI